VFCLLFPNNISGSH